MKLIVSGVVFSAAIMRSPSFSRSSSSTMTTIRPSWTSRIASSIVANLFGIWLDQILHVLGHDIEFEVNRIVGSGRFEIRVLERMGNDRDRKNVAIRQRRHRQADAVHCNRTLLNDIT